MNEETGAYLWHYTTAEGLIGIITAKAVWATNIFYMNDLREWREGIELAIEELNGLAGRPESEGNRQCISEATSMLRRVDERMYGLSVYVACFSRQPDLLSQWRAYCPRGGYAIGFPKQKLGIAASESGFTLMDCVYDRQQQCELIRNEVSRLLVGESRTQESPPERAEALVGALLFVSTRIKNRKFTEEEEFRLVLGRDADNEDAIAKQFRPCGAEIIPYVECRISDGLLQEAIVYVGPCPYASAYAASVGRLLGCCNPEEFKTRVRTSDIPFRYR